MRTAIRDDDEFSDFECCDEHNKLLEMLTALRSRDLPENDPHEAQRMITVRIPKSLHDSICNEANRWRLVLISSAFPPPPKSGSKHDPNLGPKTPWSPTRKRRGKKATVKSQAETVIPEYRPLEE